MPSSGDGPDSGMSPEQVRAIVEIVVGDSFDIFKDAVSVRASVDPSHYHLHPEIAVSAISDAVSDIRRAAGYHSSTGPSNIRIAAYIGWWIAHARPIQISQTLRIEDSYNDILAKDVLSLNSIFAVFCVITLLGGEPLPPNFCKSLRYTFHYRPRHDPEAIAVMINAALEMPVTF